MHEWSELAEFKQQFRAFVAERDWANSLAIETRDGCRFPQRGCSAALVALHKDCTAQQEVRGADGGVCVAPWRMDWTPQQKIVSRRGP